MAVAMTRLALYGMPLFWSFEAMKRFFRQRFVSVYPTRCRDDYYRPEFRPPGRVLLRDVAHC